MFEWLTPELREDVIDGLIITIGLTLVTSIASFVLGYWAALGRSGHQPIRRRIAGIYVEIFRNVPALILVLFFAFAVPNIVPIEPRRTLFFDNPVVDALGTVTGVPIPYYLVAAVLALSLNTGAHLAEIIRSGFNSVPISRVDAARSLGASELVALRAVVAPIGIRVAFPAITNRLVHNLKNTSLASFVAVPELFQTIQGEINRTFQATTLLLFAAVMYLALSTVMTFGLQLVEQQLGRIHGETEPLRV